MNLEMMYTESRGQKGKTLLFELVLEVGQTSS